MNDTTTVAAAPGRAQMTLTLRKPLIDAEGGGITELVLREPLARDLVQFEQAPAGMGGVVAVQACCGLPIIASKMPARDFLPAMRFINGFFDAIPYEGEPPEQISIALAEPVETEAGLKTAIDLHEPTAFELGKFGGMSGAKGDIDTVAVISGWDPKDVGKLTATDLHRATGYIDAFFR